MKTYNYKVTSGSETLLQGRLVAFNKQQAIGIMFKKIATKKYINGLTISLDGKIVYKEKDFPIFKRWVARKVDNRPKNEW